jgi:hypothetical protein
MRISRAIVACACLHFCGVAVGGAGEASPPRLPEPALRDIFRIIVGQPQLEDDEIGTSLDARGLEPTWTCVWSGEAGGEVIVLQIRDRDGAYRRPEMTDLSSLKFGIRIDLRERIGRIVANARKEQPAPRGPASGKDATDTEREETKTR